MKTVATLFVLTKAAVTKKGIGYECSKWLAMHKIMHLCFD